MALVFGSVLLAGLLPFLMLPGPEALEPEKKPSPRRRATAPREPSGATAPRESSEPLAEPTSEKTRAPSVSRRRDIDLTDELRERLTSADSTAGPELLERAERAIRERRLDEAERYLEQAEKRGAPRGDIASYRAMMRWARGDRNGAAGWARDAIRLSSQVDLAEMHHIVGQAHYYAQELPRAIEEFSIALEYRDDPNIRASLETARREARTAGGFRRQRLSHFIVSYEGETMESVGRMAIDTLDRNYSSLVSEFGFEPSEPVAVLLYTRRSYREMGGPHWSSGAFDGKIRIPVKDISWGDSTIRKTLHHELAHAFIRSHVGSNIPRWMNEGLAQYVEGIRTRTVARELAPHVSAGSSLGTCVLSQACDVHVFYPAAASMVDYLTELRGMGGIRDVLDGLADGDSIETCLQKTYGRDTRSLVRDWEGFLRRRV